MTGVQTCALPISLAPSYRHLSSISAGKAAERAAELKVAKYSAISVSHEFLPIALETLGPMNPGAAAFVSSLGKRIATVTGDARESAFLFQRLSMTLQRFNCIALHDSFASSEADDQLRVDS